MEKCSPTTSPDGEGLDAGLLAEFLTDDDELLLSPELQELLEVVMRELYEEISPQEKEAALSPTSPEVASSSSSPAVEGESCGASVSDSASTVMAGVEFAGNPGTGTGPGGWCVVVEEDGKSDGVRETVGMEMDGCDAEGFWGC